MDNGRIDWRTVLLLVAVCATFFVTGYISRRTVPVYRDVVKTDTLFVEKVVTQIKPVPVEVRVVDTMVVSVHDTVRVVLPMERKVYEDSNYRAVVSGFRPSLDTMQVFRHDRTIYIDRTSFVSPPRFGVSLQVGTGLLYDIPRDRFGVGVYAGIGVHYCFGKRKK